ncbi:unnamed protein product [Prunus armeniaca]|uniref:Uncharacterized protein n=1 Tax=Prunus armeniaca TaxID=36596 RepID=A0A6J5TSR2_PRUAR|nr:unnamed protein product [Prunus armeniaca]
MSSSMSSAPNRARPRGRSVGVTKRELLEEGQLKRREGQAQCSRLLGFIHISLSPHRLSLSRALSSSDFEF